MNITQFTCPCCHWQADLDFKISDTDKQAIIDYLRDQLSPIHAINQVAFYNIGNWFGIYVDTKDFDTDVLDVVFNSQYELEQKFRDVVFNTECRQADIKKMEHGEAGMVFAR